MTVHTFKSEALARGARMLRTALGADVAAWLEDPAVVEVMLNPDGRLWVDRLCEGLADTGEELSAADGERIVRLVAHHIGAEVHAGSPRVSAELPGTGERFEGLLPPVVAAPVFAIRKPAVAVFTLEDYVRAGIMPDDAAAALCDAITSRANILVAGGTSTGKTVTARKILSFVPSDERIITIEEAAELRPTQPNVVTLMSDRDEATRSADVLLTSTLRMRPDRIVLGEVRGKEAMTFLEAINTGHGGSLTTLHAETPQLAVQRLAIAALKTDVPMTYQDMNVYITRSIDVIIQAGRHEGARGITEFYLPVDPTHSKETAHV